MPGGGTAVAHGAGAHRKFLDRPDIEMRQEKIRVRAFQHEHQHVAVGFEFDRRPRQRDDPWSGYTDTL